ncbi:MAG: phosphatidate cytidylyltransferase [Bacteroidales bacterium]|nr:phosphatidate cytidylyltransferase [Bacteroidales bacterium]
MKKLLIRTLSSIVYAAIVAAGLLINKYCFLAFILLVTVLMMNEFQKMSLGKKYPVQQVITILAGLSVPAAVFGIEAFGWNTSVLAFLFIGLFAICASLLFLKDRSQLSDAFALFASILYLAIPMSIFNLGVFSDGSFSGMYVLVMFCIVAMSDVGGYVFGMAIGQKYGRRLCPSISPKKTWTGVWGGIVFSIATALFFYKIGWLSLPLTHVIVLAILIDVAGVFGDLIESIWKRFYNLKDSGNIIPGHGGMMDRFDSALIAIPMGIVYLILFNLI